ncbi:MAG: hypothetical protein H0X46_10095 [Bacteroidetes bacterium]|nr:hypothetical protein [Bacteroidota bacterium]
MKIRKVKTDLAVTETKDIGRSETNKEKQHKPKWAQLKTPHFRFPQEFESPKLLIKNKRKNKSNSIRPQALPERLLKKDNKRACLSDILIIHSFQGLVSLLKYMNIES